MGRVLVVVMLVAGCGRFGFAPGSGGDDAPEPDAPIDNSVPSAPSICNARTLTTGVQGAEVAVMVRATALASGGYAVAVGTDSGTVHVVRIMPDGSFGGVHTPLTMVYALRSISNIDDNVFVYAINGGSTGYIKALDATWDAYATAQSGEPTLNDPALAAVPGTARGWVGMRSGGITTLAEVDAGGFSTGLVADYQPPGAVDASLTPTTTGVRAAVDLGTGSCETLLIAPTGVTSAREMITPCHLPNLHPFAGDSSVLLYQITAGVFAARIVHASPAVPEPTVMLGVAEYPRVMTRDGRVWIASRPSATEPVELRAMDPDGSIEPGTAPGLVPPFDLLTGAAFWIDGDDLRGGEPCVN